MQVLTTFIVAACIVMAIARSAMADGGAAVSSSGPTSVLGFTMKDIDGNDVPLSKYAGKVLLIVNVASKCGNTPQYKPMEEMYEKYKDQGFEILAFPANNFASQEPGPNAQIKEFCSNRYSVTFPLFSKISVKGPDQDPLYQFLTGKSTDPNFGGAIEWNFAKFLIDRNGNIVGRFKAGHYPDSEDVVSAIEDQLKKPTTN